MLPTLPTGYHTPVTRGQGKVTLGQGYADRGSGPV